MNRPHTVKDFVDFVKTARHMLGDVLFATDIIVGYPTETEDDFNDTVELLEKINMDVVNVSKYSPRPGTKAAELPLIPHDIISNRTRRLRELLISKGMKKNEKFVGSEVEVLITEKQRDYTGRTRTYKQVAVKDFEGEIGDFVFVNVESYTATTLVGKVSKK